MSIGKSSKAAPTASESVKRIEDVVAVFRRSETPVTKKRPRGKNTEADEDSLGE